MTLDRGDVQGRRRFAAALRAGEPVGLTDRAVRQAARDGVAPERFVPLAHTVDSPWRALLPPAARRASAEPVTVIVPSSRGRPLGLDAWRAQDVPVRVRVLANGAWQGREEPEVEHVQWRGHGPTRAAALDTVDTPWVLFSVDDAIPLGAGFVRALMHACADADVATARQIPWPDADAATAARVCAWTPWFADGAPRPWATVDHVAAIYRTELLRRFPVPAVSTAEDWVWARRFGGAVRLVYAPAAAVLHSHPPRLRATFARARAEHQVRRAEGEAPRLRSAWEVACNLPGAAAPGLRAWSLRAALAGAAELLGAHPPRSPAGERPASG